MNFNQEPPTDINDDRLVITERDMADADALQREIDDEDAEHRLSEAEVETLLWVYSILF